MELVEGIYQIKIPPPGAAKPSDNLPSAGAGKEGTDRGVLGALPSSHVNIYLIEGEKENLLIDAGWNTPDALSILENELKTNGFELKDISQIVVTHLHPDHYGLAGKIRELSGAKIALCEIEAKMLESRYMKLSNLLERMMFFLYANGVPRDEVDPFSKASLPAREFVVPATPDVKLKPGKKISVDPFEFKLILSPGHSPGHLCLYEPNRKLLFTGDQVLPEISPHVGFHPQSGTDPLGDYLNSLESLMQLDVNLAFPGHGPAFNGLSRRIEELLYHHEQRKSVILEVIKNGMKTAYQVAMEIPWMTDIKGSSFESLDTWNRRLAVMETLAHLVFLEKQGKVKTRVQDGMNYYWVG